MSKKEISNIAETRSVPNKAIIERIRKALRLARDGYPTGSSGCDLYCGALTDLLILEGRLKG